MKILTDSAADLRPEEIERLGIQVIPLTIHFPEGEVKSGDLAPDEFYNRLRSMAPAIPTTSQPSAGAFAETYRRIVESGEEVLSIHISSGLSGTIEAARTGAQQLRGGSISLVDTLTLSGGERFQVLAAVLASQANWGKQAILERLDRIRAETEVVFTLDTLEYLRRGGRIGRVQALAGSLLKIKPVIHVDKRDGKYSNAGRGRTIRQALEGIAGYLVRTYGNTKPVWVTVMHGQFSDGAETLAGLLKGTLNISKFEVLRVSPVLGVHTGPGVVGAAVVPLEVLEGLK